MNGPFDLEPAAWARLRELLDQVLPLGPEARGAWFAALPAADAALVPRLHSLLANASAVQFGTGASTADGESLPHMAARLMQTLPRIETGQFAGRPPAGVSAEQVGPYRLLHELGHGGMASVWLAERTDVLQGRRAAVKLPLGAWHGAGLAERLARERAILATLNHPNIATLFDAGVDVAGRPWLALEYVEGERIDLHCQRLKLDIAARLRLIVQVARAVVHAHANLVVHRDLKPGNILVTGDGQVKLLDFGIAKLLEQDLLAGDATSLTQQAGRVLTPDYAAPEQILGRPVGTAADVYALGVVLYELLAGVRPYTLARDSRSALEAAIARVQPPPPSSAAAAFGPAWQRALRGDLDTIVARAMKPEPMERYATVAALAEDLQRHLDGQPVAARPDRLAYRLHKFVARHRLGVAATAVALLAVLGGAGLATWQAQVARAEQRRAEDVKAFIASVFADADPWRAQRGKTSAAELLKRARARVDLQYAAAPSIRVELLNVIGSSLAGLEEYDSAEAVLLDAVAVGEQALIADDALRLRSHQHLASLYGSAQLTDKLKAELARLLPLLRARESEFGAELVEALVAQVQVDNDEGRYPDMEATARQALLVADRHLPEDGPMRVLARRSLANALENQGKFADARRESTAAFELSSRIFRAEPQHPLHNDTRFIHARIMSAGGDHAAALPLMQQSIAVAEGILGPGSLHVATMVREMVSPLMETHRLREAHAASEGALAILRRHHGDNSVHLAYAMVAHGTIMRELRRGDVGRTEFEAAVRVLAPELGADHAYTLDVRANAALGRALSGDAHGAAAELDVVSERYLASGQQVLGKVIVYRAMAHRLSGRAAKAAEILRPALASMPAPVLARARLEMAEIHIALNQPAEALALLRLLPPRDAALRPSHAESDLALGRALLATGDAAHALPFLQRADTFWQDFEPRHRRATDAASWLARCLAALGRSADAGVVLERLPRT
jgi:eukaryotic-like serine/threonine-protein kinase